jgi:hypothetical protein
MWRIEFDPKSRVVSIRVTDYVGVVQVRDLARAHAEALEHTGGEEFRVYADLRGLFPLDAESVAIFGDMKRVAASVPGFRGAVILVDSPTIAMQQRRTTIESQPSGARATAELITNDEAEAKRYAKEGG